MAQFNLARIRYNWKNVWLPGATYIKDDIVRNGGNTYNITVLPDANIGAPTRILFFSIFVKQLVSRFSLWPQSPSGRTIQWSHSHAPLLCVQIGWGPAPPNIPRNETLKVDDWNPAPPMVGPNTYAWCDVSTAALKPLPNISKGPVNSGGASGRPASLHPKHLPIDITVSKDESPASGGSFFRAEKNQ